VILQLAVVLLLVPLVISRYLQVQVVLLVVMLPLVVAQRTPVAAGVWPLMVVVVLQVEMSQFVLARVNLLWVAR
jgi:hypothetical protein